MKYIDPDGRMDVDFENKTVSFDINSGKDTEIARSFLAKNEDFSISAIDSNKGTSLSFDNFEQMDSYFANPPTDGVSIALSFAESVSSTDAFGTAMDGGSSYYGFIGDTVKSTRIGIVGALLTARLAFKSWTNDNPIWGSQVCDLFGGASGFVNPVLPLAYHLYKPVVIETARAGASVNIAFKKDPWGSFNKMFSLLSGSNVKFGR